MDSAEAPSRARLTADQQTLANMEQELESILRQRDVDTVTLRALQQKVADADADVSDLTARRDSLRNSINRRRAALAPRSLPAFPLEVLGIIFVLAADALAEQWSPDCDPSVTPQRSLQPFRCAAVCRRWHRAAIVTPALWAYIGVPNSLAEGSLWPSRVQQLLLRSRACKLHVAVESTSDGFNIRYGPILISLLQHSSRWESLLLLGHGRKNDHTDALRLLRAPTPSLEIIRVVFPVASSTPGRAALRGYLPHAPLLRHAHFCYVPVPLARDDSTKLPATLLALYEDVYYLRRFAQTISSFPALLTLKLHWNDVVRDGSTQFQPDVLLPSLRCLVLGRDREGDADPDSFTNLLDTLVMPILHELDMTPDMLSVARGLISRHAATVEVVRFRLGYLEYADQVPIVEFLAEVREVSLDTGGITRSFLDALAPAASSIWPKLQRLTLIDTQELDIDPFVSFFRARYAPGAEIAPSCAPLELDVTEDDFRHSVAAGEIALILENDRKRRSSTTDDVST